jgi:hypothetical protein
VEDGVSIATVILRESGLRKGQSAAMSEPTLPMRHRVEDEAVMCAAPDAVWEVLSEFHAVDT